MVRGDKLYRSNMELTIIWKNTKGYADWWYRDYDVQYKELSSDATLDIMSVAWEWMDLFLPKKVITLWKKILGKSFCPIFEWLFFDKNRVVGSDTFCLFEHTIPEIKDTFILPRLAVKALWHMGDCLKYKTDGKFIEITDGEYTIISALIKWIYPDIKKMTTTKNTKKQICDFSDVIYKAVKLKCNNIFFDDWKIKIGKYEMNNDTRFEYTWLSLKNMQILNWREFVVEEDRAIVKDLFCTMVVKFLAK